MYTVYFTQCTVYSECDVLNLNTCNCQIVSTTIVREVKKKNIKKMDGLSPTYLKTPPPPPPPLKMDYVFFHHCFIVLFQFLDILFTLKVKKKRAKVDSTRNPPPIVD